MKAVIPDKTAVGKKNRIPGAILKIDISQESTIERTAISNSDATKTHPYLYFRDGFSRIKNGVVAVSAT